MTQVVLQQLDAQLKGQSCQWAQIYSADRLANGASISMATMAGFRLGNWSWVHFEPQPTRILVVDDEPELRDIFQLILSNLGYQVTLVECGLDAVSALSTDPPYDLMVCDVGLPDVRGNIVVEKCQILSPETEVIMASAFSDPAIMALCYTAGATDYIVKPFKNARLIAGVADALTRRTLRATDSALARFLGDPYPVIDVVVAARIASGAPVYYQELAGVFGLTLKPGIDPLANIPEDKLRLSAMSLIQDILD